MVFLGDCLDICSEWPAAQADMVYLDPPFFTRRDHVGKARNGPLSTDTLTFSDRWQGGFQDFLTWLERCVRAAWRLLKPTGVFLLHLDWHAVHYAKVMCDGIFAEAGGQFQNELIWYYQTGGASKERFSRKHDTILLYSMSETFYFDGKAVAIPRAAGAMKRARCPTGARIKLTDTHKNPDDVLVIPALNPMATERNGYPTQKPIALLETLIKALCPPGGLVADLCCGSGTTLLAAQHLGRKWVGCDVNPHAVELARTRLADTTHA
jgi:site-specific DNA-methyltransferase (adenine-specific)